ncbi:hypothetical protein MHBO_003094, partial [Bonamia ostreae]
MSTAIEKNKKQKIENKKPPATDTKSNVERRNDYLKNISNGPKETRKSRKRSARLSDRIEELFNSNIYSNDVESHKNIFKYPRKHKTDDKKSSRNNKNERIF